MAGIKIAMFLFLSHHKDEGQYQQSEERLRTLEHKSRQAMYVQRNIEARSRKHRRRRKALSIPYFCVCVCVRARGRVGVNERARACACTRVALLIRQARRRHIVSYGLYRSTTFCDIISQTA